MFKKYLLILAVLAVSVIACEEPEEVIPDIQIAEESAAAFSEGISFGEYTGTEPQTSKVTFTATDAWSATIAETKAPGWITVEPSSGEAGKVEMTISAQPNKGEEPRKADITIKCGTVSKTITVTQAGNPPAVIEVKQVTLDKEEISLVEGEEFTLTATVEPGDATDKTVTWSSSNNEVASVGEAGKVTAMKEGEAEITAAAGDVKATCKVTVTKKYIVVESIVLDKPELSLIKGESATLTATVSPADATNPAVSWISSDETVASVKDGVVTALKSGTATITATAENQNATCVVTVTNPATGITLDHNDLFLTEGESAVLTVTITPADADEQTVTWKSSDPNVATVDENGKVTAKAEGSATITATCGDLVANCQVTVDKLIVPVESVSLNKTDLNLTEGESFDLVATVNPEIATDKTVSWKSSNDKVAEVDANGKVTAKQAGEAFITAKAGEKSAVCKVTVAKLVIPVESVSLNKTVLDLTEGDTFDLVATIAPDNATDKSVTWDTSNKEIAIVDVNGKVTAMAPGTATITARAGDKHATCTVSVAKLIIPLMSLSLNASTLTLAEGDTYVLVPTFNPTNATDQNVSWTSSNGNVATVDANGKVTAKAAGQATITAKVGDVTATCAVTVQQNVVAVTSVTLDKSQLNLKEGEIATLFATVKPDNATNKTVTWVSSDSGVVTVDANGKVTAVSAGQATITATAGNASATCAVTVQPNVIAVTSVTLDKNKVEIEVGADVTLVATVNPSNATDKSVTWTTDNPKVASVDANGKVTGVSEGQATISAKAGDYSAACTVTVVKGAVKVTSVTIDKDQIELGINQTYQLSATVLPDNADDKTVTWSSSDESIATVTETDSYGGGGTVILGGLVTGKKAGQATITATAGGKQATCTVSVNGNIIAVASISLDKQEVNLQVGGTQQLTATVLPDNATDKKVTWASLNTNIATVQNGLITGVAVGETYVTATAGDKQAYCFVKVEQSTAPAVPVEKVTLNKKSTEIEIGQSEQLVATIQPANATNKTVTWTSSNTNIATVQDGLVTGVMEGTVTITATASGKQATCTVLVKEPYVEELVDLGLSVYWRAWNLGATKPVEYGDFFAWGDPEKYYTEVYYTGQTWGWDATGWTTTARYQWGYNWRAYKYWISGFNSWSTEEPLKVSKYNNQEGHGPVDNKTVLDPEDDAASVILGNGWRTPTKEEWLELYENCTSEYLTNAGYITNNNYTFAVHARRFTSKINGKSIVLPLAGHIHNHDCYIPGSSSSSYWSASYVESFISDNNQFAPSRAWIMSVGSNQYTGIATEDRPYGHSIRPVKSKQ
ncbi:MAG: Ig-like domain-containing protein [Bacteroidales bacterium]|nr:Ig-like domain-containing protein [Bacteroidales bacterium]